MDFLNNGTLQGGHLISRVVYIQVNTIMYNELFLRNCMTLIFLQQQSEGVHSEDKVQRLKKFKQVLYVEDMLV